MTVPVAGHMADVTCASYPTSPISCGQVLLHLSESLFLYILVVVIFISSFLISFFEAIAAAFLITAIIFVDALRILQRGRRYGFRHILAAALYTATPILVVSVAIDVRARNRIGRACLSLCDGRAASSHLLAGCTASAPLDVPPC